MNITPSHSQHWRFIFDQPQPISVDQLPAITLGWQPSELIFVAQGPGPFQLLAGNVLLPQKVGFPKALFFASDRPEPVQLLAVVAAKPMTNSSPPISPVDDNWIGGKVILWLVLLIGLLLLSIMAYQLLKSMRKAGKES